VVVDPSNPLPFFGSETLFVTDYGSHPITRSVREGGLPVLISLARSVGAGTVPDGYGSTVLMRTSSEGWGETDISTAEIERGDEDLAGPVPLGVVIEGEAEEEDGGEEDGFGGFEEFDLESEEGGEDGEGEGDGDHGFDEGNGAAAAAETAADDPGAEPAAEGEGAAGADGAAATAETEPATGAEGAAATAATDPAAGAEGAAAAAEIARRGPMRLVVFGDSNFASDQLLGASQANVVLLIDTLNWLVERESLLGIPPKEPERVRLTLTQTQMAWIYALALLILPGLAVILGVVVWFRRRR